MDEGTGNFLMGGSGAFAEGGEVVATDTFDAGVGPFPAGGDNFCTSGLIAGGGGGGDGVAAGVVLVGGIFADEDCSAGKAAVPSCSACRFGDGIRLSPAADPSSFSTAV